MKITLLIIAGFLLIAGGGFYILMSSMSDNIEKQYAQVAEEPLVDFAHLLASLVEQEISDNPNEAEQFTAGISAAYDREFFARIYQLEKTEIHTQIYITDQTGSVIYDSDAGKRVGQDYSEYNDVYLASRGKYGARATRADPNDHKTTVFYIAAPIYHEGEIIGTLTVSRPETAMAAFAEEAHQHILRAGWITAAYVFSLGVLWVYLILHPIRKLTRNALQISEGKRVTLSASGIAELRTLGIALEKMRRELEGKHYVEHYVQALTHELKSPLAAIRGAAELIDERMPEPERQKFLDNILNETTRSEDMVRRLVQLASIESQSNLATLETFSLSALIEEELTGLQTLTETRNLTIKTSGFDQPATIEGDPLMIRIAIRNGLSNAFDFSPAGGIVEIGIDCTQDAIVLTIQDQGPGIPDYAQGRIFDRFYSLKNETTGRKGSGIGLTFVRTTMDLHDGEATLENHTEGGAILTLRFSAS